jgi:hypothetical protein
MTSFLMTSIFMNKTFSKRVPINTLKMSQLFATYFKFGHKNLFFVQSFTKVSNNSVNMSQFLNHFFLILI